MNYSPLLADIERHVSKLFKDNETEKLAYHNLAHTKEVVRHVEEILLHEKIPGEDRFVVLATAWFHDTGLLFVEASQHVQKSVELMTTFFYRKESRPGTHREDGKTHRFYRIHQGAVEHPGGNYL